MPTATVTSKGQITIPKAIRDSLKISSGDRLEFVITQAGQATIRPLTKTVRDIYGLLHDPDQRTVSIEEMDEAIAKAVCERNS